MHGTTSSFQMAWVIFRRESGAWLRTGFELILMLPFACRYANMDFVLLSALRIFRQHGDNGRLPINIVYDIACQYSTNLLYRVDHKHPPSLQLPDHLRNIKPFVPKFHLPAHGSACQTKYSLNLHQGCGRTYGERTEQEWAHTKKCAAATLEMGPGARHITLDDQWGGWNWERLIGLGEYLPRYPFQTEYYLIHETQRRSARPRAPRCHEVGCEDAHGSG